METLDLQDEKEFTVVIETLVNASRDFSSENPEIKSYWYDVKASDEVAAKEQAKKLFADECPWKGIWCIDVL